MGIFNEKRATLLIHIAIWLLIGAVPVLLLYTMTTPVEGNRHLVKLIENLVTISTIFYFNYFILINRYLFTRRTVKFVLFNVVLVLIISFANKFVHQYYPFEPNPERAGIFNINVKLFIFDPIAYLFVIMTAVAVKGTSRLRKSELERKEVERNNKEAELQNLKSQLNPHFLFNTLNNLYSLIYIDSERAQEVVHELSRLLRYVLYDSSKPTVTMREEVEFVANYIELMRLRLPNSVEVVVQLPERGSDASIAPLLFISPIENAFKHGVSNDKPSFVHISMEEGKESVSCRIENSLFPKSGDGDMSGSGIGIVNLSKRLEMIYPNNHRFESYVDGDKYVTILEMRIKV